MRRLTLIAATLLTATCATAQESTLTVTPQEIGLIGKALGTQPYADVAPLIQKLDAQIRQQEAARAEAAKKTEDAKKAD
jgi:Flp pilus assembly protein TadG